MEWARVIEIFGISIKKDRIKCLEICKMKRIQYFFQYLVCISIDNVIINDNVLRKKYSYNKNYLRAQHSETLT